MARKKKNSTKAAKTKAAKTKRVSTRAVSSKKTAPKKKSAKAARTPSKKKAKKKVARKKLGARRTARNARSFGARARRATPEVHAGDLQGLSSSAGADSESVDELLEEGNAFEADVVAGVEQADNADEKEVQTHEVPEDDVPGEYLDEQ
jgi:hypothetical protein